MNRISARVLTGVALSVLLGAAPALAGCPPPFPESADVRVALGPDCDDDEVRWTPNGRDRDLVHEGECRQRR